MGNVKEGWDARSDLVEAWRTNHRINLYLIEGITEEGLRATLSTRGGRDVARQFAHLHNVRIWHLEKRARDLAEGLVQFEGKYSPKREELIEALGASADAVETFLTDVLAGAPKRRAFKKGLFTTLSYLIAHDSHHRGSILLTLKQCGLMPGQEVTYGIWGWDQR